MTLIYTVHEAIIMKIRNILKYDKEIFPIVEKQGVQRDWTYRNLFTKMRQIRKIYFPRHLRP